MVALLLALVMLLGLLPAGALAAEPENNSLGTVRVIVENMTAKKGQDLGTVGTCPWAGKLVDTDVEMEAGDNGITLVAKAVKKTNESYAVLDGENKPVDKDAAYIASINGLAGGDYTEEENNGWMCTLNDFFCNRSLSEFRVSATDPNYSLSDGDVIHVMYTTNGLGSDLGGSWYNSNTTLESLGVEGGELTSTFSSGEAGGSYDYTLLIDSDSANITLTPTAANKNYLVRTYLNVKDIGAAEGPGLYKRTESIPVAAGEVI